MRCLMKIFVIGVVCSCLILMGGTCEKSLPPPEECASNPTPSDWAKVSAPEVKVECDVRGIGAGIRFKWQTLGDEWDWQYSGILSDLNYTIEQLEPYQVYNWSIVVYSNDGGTACYGPVWHFTTGGKDCYDFQPLSPPLGEEVRERSVTLAAADIGISEDYQHRFKIGLNRNDLQWLGPASNRTSTVVSDLVEDTVYYWQVWAVDGENEICGSVIWDFLTPKTYNCISESIPADSDTVRSRSVLLTWLPKQTGPGWRWIMRIGLKSDDPYDIETFEGYEDLSELLITDLVMDTSYVWSLNISNEIYQTQCTSEEMVFYTRLPNPPTNPSPGNYDTDISQNVVLTWDFEQPPGDPYLFNIYLQETGGTSIVGENLTNPTFDPGGLLTSEEYGWYVIAHNSSYDSISSAYWQFYTVGASPGGIYANLMIETEYFDQYTSYDNIRARFDSVYNPSQSVEPLQADSVKCEDWKLNWSDFSNSYDYGYVPGLFEFDSTYTFHVYGTGAFPDMLTSITFPGCIPTITSPAYPDTVSFTGFEVQWDNFCTGQVVLTIMDGEDSTGVWVVTDNDGSYTFPADSLAYLNNIAKSYFLVVMVMNHKTFDAGGYDPRSTITARTYQKIFLPMK